MNEINIAAIKSNLANLRKHNKGAIEVTATKIFYIKSNSLYTKEDEQGASSERDP